MRNIWLYDRTDVKKCYKENNVKELNQLGISYNKMLERLSEAFEIQRQFTANAAHELRTPLALMQVQLDLYNSASHPGNNADTVQTIKMAVSYTHLIYFFYSFTYFFHGNIFKFLILTIHDAITIKSYCLKSF